MVAVLCGDLCTMIAQLLLSLVLVFVVYKLIHYGRQYLQWLQLTSQITPLGKLHPIWGHFTLVRPRSSVHMYYY